MSHIKILRLCLLFIIIIFIFVTAYSASSFEQITCMDVPVLTSEDQIICRSLSNVDLSECFFFKGEPAAVDRESRTIYISQSVSQNTRYQDLEGNLTLAYKNFHLYFTPDSYFSNLQTAIADGHRFQLLAVSPDGEYMEYFVVFTSFPVINMVSPPSENGWNFSGNFYLWAPNDPEQLRYNVKTSTAAWHIRGGATTSMPKKSWKLTLTSQGKNSGLSLLGLGKDDDWILNGLSLDDTALKEKLFMHLWNQMVTETSYNHPMSIGEYVEVVINQDYQGIYLIQRRIDGRYLDLPSNSILIKGMKTNKLEQVHDNYEIVNSPLAHEDTYSLLEDMWNGDCTMFNIDNFVDINLFFHFASAMDNTKFKNILYALEDNAVTLIPWDTDMSFGVIWTNTFVYDYNKSLNHIARRMEFEQMQVLHPDLDSRMSQRWKQLRQGVLSEENIISQLAQLESLLAANGMPKRDLQRWGSYYGGEDRTENIYRYIKEKLVLMDEYYR